MNDTEKPDIQVTNLHVNYFVRNKDHSKIHSILKENRERVILLNTRHNMIDVRFFTGEYYKSLGKNIERLTNDWFGVSYEILDVMFEKYKTDKTILIKLAKFCMHSKSKTYWLKLKHSSFSQEIMAAVLGGADENA